MNFAVAVRIPIPVHPVGVMIALPAVAGPVSTAIRDSAEYVMTKFGRGVAGQTVEEVTDTTARAITRHGDEVLPLVPALDAGRDLAGLGPLRALLRWGDRRRCVMKPSAPTDLGRELVRFFEEFLPGQRGLSPNTVRSYRDVMLLLLQFTAADAKRPVDRLQVSDLTAERVAAFLNHLQSERSNGIATRNARLGAIHVFARFLAARMPEALGTLQRVIAVPYKRGAREVPIEYLERAEIEAVLQSIDRSNALGRRDYALFALMFNTGARVQEALDLRRRDVRLDAPPQVRLHGKGNKVRLCPIWPVTAKLLRAFIDELPVSDGDPADALLFTNARGRPLTRFGVRYLLRRYVAAAAEAEPSLRDKSIHPHSLRHSTAIALLKSGVDFATISQWLGHAGLNTTMRYARADIDLKRQAIAQVFPDALAPPRGGRFQPDGRDLVGWLRKM